MNLRNASVADMENYGVSKRTLPAFDSILGMTLCKTVILYELTRFPGLYILPNLLPPSVCSKLAQDALYEFCAPPHVTNLDALESDIPPSMFEEYIAGKMKHFQKLRWATLGYHHQWDSRTYDLKCHSSMPSSIVQLSRDFSQLFGLITGQPQFEFRPEAMIAHYYTTQSFLSGHVDDVEESFLPPLFSVSLGCSAIMLVAESKQDVPLPVLLAHGDVLIMSGAARLAVHGIPRIIAHSFHPTEAEEVVLSSRGESGQLVPEVTTVLKERRLNFNIRQVFGSPKES